MALLKQMLEERILRMPNVRISPECIAADKLNQRASRLQLEKLCRKHRCGSSCAGEVVAFSIVGGAMVEMSILLCRRIFGILLAGDEPRTIYTL